MVGPSMLKSKTEATHLFETRLLDLVQQPFPRRRLHRRLHLELAQVKASIPTNEVGAASREMTPPCHSFAASELALKTQQDARGRRRKLDGGALLDLSACQLLQMLQYKCEVQRPAVRDGPVQCFAVQRLFRRCEDKKSTFMVETTAWEAKPGWDNGPPKPDNDAAEPAKPYQWSSNWHDADEAPR